MNAVFKFLSSYSSKAVADSYLDVNKLMKIMTQNHAWNYS